MRDSQPDQSTIMETLAAYVRQHAPLVPYPAEPVRDRRVAGRRRVPVATPRSRPPEDVQAVLTVLGRRDPVAGGGGVDLSDTNLTGAYLNSVNLQGFNSTGATLTNIRAPGVDLADARLEGAMLAGADLGAAN